MTTATCAATATYQPWLTEELDGDGNLVATDKHSDPNKEHFERGYRDGLECGDSQAKSWRRMRCLMRVVWSAMS